MSDNAGQPNRERFPALQAKAEKYYLDDLRPIVKNWPKSEKFCLCQDAKQHAAELIYAIVDANNLNTRREVQKSLARADSEKAKLLICLKTANSERYITNKTLAYHQSQIMQIGSLIGGAIKYVNGVQTRTPAH